MKYFSMFSGIGGFEYGLQQSDYPFECVGYCEIDKYARSIYEKHYPNHTNYGDATRINTEDLSDFEFLVGGFPCQAFSIAGKRKGFNEARGTLFFEIARILRDKQPRYFLLENVKGLLSHDGGQTLETIFRVCDELGYNVQWAIYNSCDYNVPQSRERIFIKGYFRGECSREVLSIPRVNKSSDEPMSNTSTITTNKGEGLKIAKPVLTPDRENKRQNGRRMKEDGEPMFTLTAQDRHGVYIEKPPKQYVSEHNESPIKIYTPTKKGYDESYIGDGIRLDHPEGTTGRGRTQKDKTGALTCQGNWGTLDKDYLIRRLTPTECERLQGFPDNWTQYGKDGELISDTQRYKCCGNAVTTNVITAIVDEMFDGVEKNGV